MARLAVQKENRHLLKKLRTVATVAIFALNVAVLAAASPVAAHDGYTPSHYNARCNTGDQTYNPSASLVRTSSIGYKIVQATVTYGSHLAVCTNDGTFWDGGWALINGVNATGPSSGTFAQMGIANRACQTGVNCSNGYYNNETDFWWTPYGDGVIHAADWVDFDSDGQHDVDRDKPVVGHRYLFSVTFVSSNNFDYCITDLTQYGHDCDTVSHPAGASYWDRVWYGFETYNDASMFGYASGATADSITPMQFEYANGSLVQTITDAQERPACSWVVYGGISPDHWLSSLCTIGGGTGTSTIYAYTVAHDYTDTH